MNGPSIVLFENQRANDARDRVLVGEDTDHIGGRLLSPLSRSIGLITGLSFSVPMFGCDFQGRSVWCDHRDGGTGSTKVRTGQSVP